MFNLFRRRPRVHPWDLQAPMLSFAAGDVIALGDLYCGTQILGATGSGKTSGSMAAICRALMSSGAGGLFLCAKREDSATYQRYARECGRSHDVLIFGSEDSPLRYNFIQSELSRAGCGPGLVANLTALLSTVTEVLGRGSGRSGREGDAYFRSASEQACRNALEIQVASHDQVTIPDLLRLLTAAPTSIEQIASESWVRNSFFCLCVRTAERRELPRSQRADFEQAVGYFMAEWAPMSGRTRSGVLSTLTSALDLLSRGIARDLLSSPASNLSPEMCWDGAIVIVDIPALVYQDVARLIGVIMKYCWQRAAMRRDVTANARPACIVADESHLFAATPDWEFQAVARGLCVATVFATQSISNYLEAFGPNSEARVHSLLGNLQNQFFHQQTDTKTIAYAQELIGRRRTMMMGGSSSQSGDMLDRMMGSWGGGGESAVSGSFSEVYEHELQARDFHTLAKGGPASKWIVEAICYQGGKLFQSGRTWSRVGFRQTP